MASNEWVREMDAVLVGFENQAIFLLEKIQCCFEHTDQPLKSDFRDYFFKVSNER